MIKSEDITSLIKTAREHDNRINYSTIQITLKKDAIDIHELNSLFNSEGIEIIMEDVEPDASEDGDRENFVKPFDPTKIDIKMDKITIDSIIKRIKNDELEFDSSFQRKAGLWSKRQKSRLIESIMLRIPLPAFYFDASDDNKWQIIDGLQRVTTLKEFVIDKSFSLVDLEFMVDFNKMTYEELPRSMQRRIEETNLNAYLIGPSTPSNVKYNIFKRINTAGLVLEPQEIRNALHQGPAIDFLAEMAKSEEFILATTGSISPDRMLDREFCLRYVTSCVITYDNYDGNMENFLNDGMDYLNKISDQERNDIQREFIATMDRCRELFGKFAFRRLNTEQRRGPINKALFECWSMILGGLTEERFKVLLSERKVLIQKFTDVCTDATFLNSLKSSDKKSVQTRFSTIKKILEEMEII